MANLEEELRLDQEDDAREAEYIMQQLPADLKEQYSTEDIHYLMDLIVEYYYESGLLESSDDEIDIGDVIAVLNIMVSQWLNKELKC